MPGLLAMGPSDQTAVLGPIASTTLDQIHVTQREHVMTATISNWNLEIQNLMTGQRKESHANRLNVYADESLGVNEELLL
ncbi:hypothetical protein GN958_ATG16815 [Phytophthora infestans]|uniref:Uncharacterized protein n=1 Tax=Phytophthora infestans TaxID=4787 RepID=A0A8S9U021_PHYIN|nr:hypothetical protein GN958_ATG16815 [Phytophthora infestans]